MTQQHPFHLVDPSPWPLFISLAALTFTTAIVSLIHGYSGATILVVLGFFLICAIIYTWWRDVVREATFEGQHTYFVQLGLRFGIILFIVSEVIFFLAFFWAFFWAALAPVPEIGSIWPPHGIDVLNAWEVPFLNTFILLSSGASVTWAHHALVSGSFQDSKKAIFSTINLAQFFTLLQLIEYKRASFTISDGIYGSTFFIATGFHGFHVFIGTCFLWICFERLKQYHFTTQHHFGFEAAAWYWHFVDVVWLFLYTTIYWWGGL